MSRSKKIISVVLIGLIFIALVATLSYCCSFTGSKSLTVDDCIDWLIGQDLDGSLTEDVIKAGYTWRLYEFEGITYVTAVLKSSDSGFGYRFFYDESGIFTVDMYSGSTVSRIAGNTSSDL